MAAFQKSVTVFRMPVLVLWHLSLFDRSSFGFNLVPVNHLLYAIAQGRCRGDMTRVNSFSILAGSVTCPNDDKPQPTGAERETRRKSFYEDCLLSNYLSFRIEDYMSTTFRIASTSLPPIYVGIYLLSRYL